MLEQLEVPASRTVLNLFIEKNMIQEKKKFALDIFTVMSKLSSGNLHVWESLSLEEQKALSPLVTMRWMTGTNDLRQIIMMNEFVNVFAFNIGGNHKELMVKLLAVASSKQNQRYSWIGAKKKDASSKDTLGIQVLKETYEYSTKEAKEVYHLLQKDDIMLLAERLGWQPDELKKLKKELS